jgi:hypothetical protein
MTALAFAAKHTPKTLRRPQKRARPSEGSVAFPKGGDIPEKFRIAGERLFWYNFARKQVIQTPQRGKSRRGEQNESR